MNDRQRRAAAEALAYVHDRVDDWDCHAAPRRPRNGHLASCPDWLEPVRPGRRCGFCWAEANGRQDPPLSTEMSRRSQPLSSPDAVSTPVLVAEMSVELSACRGCFSPTDSPSGLCARCTREDTATA